MIIFADNTASRDFLFNFLKYYSLSEITFIAVIFEKICCRIFFDLQKIQFFAEYIITAKTVIIIYILTTEVI